MRLLVIVITIPILRHADYYVGTDSVFSESLGWGVRQIGYKLLGVEIEH